MKNIHKIHLKFKRKRRVSTPFPSPRERREMSDFSPLAANSHSRSAQLAGP